MKNKSLLIVFLMVIALAAYCTSSYAAPPQDFEPEKIQFYQYHFQQEESNALLEAEFRKNEELNQSIQLAQYEVSVDGQPRDEIRVEEQKRHKTTYQPSYQTQASMPFGSVEPNVMSQYGIVGFTVFTALSLVVYIVRSDRTTMTNLTKAIQDNAIATQKHAEATRRLAEKVDDKLDSLANDIRTQFRAMNDLISKLEDNSR